MKQMIVSQSKEASFGEQELAQVVKATLSPGDAQGSILSRGKASPKSPSPYSKKNNNTKCNKNYF